MTSLRDGTKQSAKRRDRVRTTLRLIADHEPIRLARLRELDAASAACVTKYALACWIEQNDKSEYLLTPEGREVLAKHEQRHGSA